MFDLLILQGSSSCPYLYRFDLKFKESLQKNMSSLLEKSEYNFFFLAQLLGVTKILCHMP